MNTSEVYSVDFMEHCVKTCNLTDIIADYVQQAFGNVSFTTKKEFYKIENNIKYLHISAILQRMYSNSNYISLKK